MTYYIDWRPIDCKPPIWIIIDDNGNIANRNPSKDELKGLKRFPKENYKKNRSRNSYTKEQLLNELKRFFIENGRPPVETDFYNNPKYPSFKTYQRYFGSWSNALKLVGLDVDSMVEKGVIVTRQQKARLAEIKVINHFRQHPVDLARENQNSSCDGICPNGKTYDVKSSGPHMSGYYQFGTRNKHKEEIEIYYFLAFNEDYTKLEYAWRVPGEITERDYFRIGKCHAEFTIENMKEYDITNKLKKIYQYNDSESCE